MRFQNMRSHSAIVVLTWLVCCVALPPASAATSWPTAEWPTSTPEEQGMSSAALADLVEFGALNAADFGVPQLRERVFIIGSRNGQRFKFPSPTHFRPDSGEALAGKERHRTTWDAFADLPPIGMGITLAIGAIALLTGTIGFCPVWSLFGINTCPMDTVK